jgi:hypothetical protein
VAESHAGLEQFIDMQIDKLEQELECPVCFEPATIPIMKCEEDHLICSACRERVNECPECRTPHPPGPHRR